MKKLIALILLAIASVAIADTVVVTDSGKVLQCKTFCDDDGKNCKVICL